MRKSGSKSLRNSSITRPTRQVPLFFYASAENFQLLFFLLLLRRSFEFVLEISRFEKPVVCFFFFFFSPSDSLTCLFVSFDLTRLAWLCLALLCSPSDLYNNRREEEEEEKYCEAFQKGNRPRRPIVVMASLSPLQHAMPFLRGNSFFFYLSPA